MNAPAPAIVVMAKAPRPGHVKTRLHPLLGPEHAATLQATLIAHTCDVAHNVAAVYLAVEPASAHSEVDALTPPGVRVIGQVGADLGARMATAVDQVQAAGHAPVLVVGSDAPTLGPDRLREALVLLATPGVDAVLGPALDGGYYLIGLSTPVPEAFSIDAGLWGGPDVLAATRQALRAGGRSVRLLAPLRDLDTPEDAAALLADPELPRAVRDRLVAVGGRA